MNTTSPQRTAAGAVIFAAGTFALCSATGLLSPHAAKLIGNHSMTVFPLAAAVGAALAARVRFGRERAAWILFMLWGLLSGWGNAMWEYYEFFSHRDVPFPSWADVGYLGGNLCALAAVCVLAFGPVRTRWRLFIDASLIALSTFLISWVLLLGKMWGNPGSLLEKATGLAYPVIDVAIVSMIVLVWTRTDERMRGTLSFVGTALLGWAFSDSGFAYLTMRGTYHSGSPIDAGWIGGDALIALAAFLAWRSAPVAARSDDKAGRLRLYLPYAVAGFALVVVPIANLVSPLDAAVFVALIGLLVLVVFRQFLAMLDSKQVTINELRSIDEMKNGILNAVSHELRTPLTYVKGTAYMLQDETLPDAIKKDLVGDLVKSADRLEETLTGLLDLGRLSRGVLEPSRRETDISALLLAVAEELRTREHVIRVRSASLKVNIDPVQVERIVENLYRNGVRHTPPGTEIVASAVRTDEGVLITVEDNGPGVPPEKRDEIFKAFVQSDHTVQFGRGTGVGLSIVTKFAELHGGRAWVEESQMGGAKFCVLLADGQSSAAVA
jgi:signal transduction histidine kinase